MVQAKVAEEIGDSAASVLVLGFAESVTAQRFKLIANFETGEFRIVDTEIAIEGETVNDLFFAGREKHFGS